VLRFARDIADGLLEEIAQALERARRKATQQQERAMGTAPGR